jgi:hypothetical protein
MLLNLLIGFLVIGIIVGTFYAGWKIINNKKPVTSGKLDPDAKIGRGSGCPTGQARRGGKCTSCGLIENMKLINGKCACPLDSIEKDGRCVPCPKDRYINDGVCTKCDGNGRAVLNGECVDCYKSKKIVNTSTGTCEYCDPGYVFNPDDNSCMTCPENNTYVGSGATAKCEPCGKNHKFTGSGATSKCTPYKKFVTNKPTNITALLTRNSWDAITNNTLKIYGNDRNKYNEYAKDCDANEFCMGIAFSEKEPREYRGVYGFDFSGYNAVNNFFDYRLYYRK